MRKRRAIELFSISFLDILSGALGAVIILYVALPKSKSNAVEVETTSKSEAVYKELAESEEKIKKLEIEIKKNKVVQATQPVPSESAGNFDIGFKFKGKNIVFIIDTSYSMVDEDRMGQVKAGIKMLITSLSDSYKIDVVQYPLGERAPFKSLWGDIKQTTGFNKTDVFEFIYRMRPAGGTPTRDALLFVLKNYETTTDIVLLTDGVPTKHNSNKKDDIYDILQTVRAENPRQIQINTIGVGSDFAQDKTNDRYRFLSLLSEQNNGFFVGF